MRFAMTAILAVAMSARVQATVQVITTFSPSNNKNITFRVYTPPGYSSNPTQRYPMVMSLHGIGSNSSARENQVVPTLDAAITAGQVTPMIYVFADGQNNSFYGDAFDGHKQVYSNIINEVLPYVDANFRTYNDRKLRAMEGFSMGGYGAMTYAVKRTDLFSAVVEYAGALTTWSNMVTFNSATASEMYNNVEANFLPYSLYDLTDANKALIRDKLDALMIVGGDDSQRFSNQQYNSYLNGKLASVGGSPVSLITIPGIDHDGAALYQQGVGLDFLNDHFLANLPEPTTFTLLAPAVWLLAKRRRTFLA